MTIAKAHFQVFIRIGVKECTQLKLEIQMQCVIYDILWAGNTLFLIVGHNGWERA